MVPTLNIGRIASEGFLFTDQYAQPTCTPGRAAFITCQLPIRTGMTTVGMPDSPIGLDRRDPSLAKLLKSRGYATGRFGKNHLGDRNSHLPTVHRFDEFYGNLSHLNTEQEPELGDWPQNAALNQRYRPRGVLDAQSSNRDEKFLVRTKQRITSSAQARKHFFAWFAASRMHIYTHLKPESAKLAKPYSSQLDLYGSGLIEHDGHVGQLLERNKLKTEFERSVHSIMGFHRFWLVRLEAPQGLHHRCHTQAGSQ